MPSVNGFQAWLAVNDATLDEFKVEIAPDGRTVTCCVPSEAGKAFQIHWRDTARPRTVATSGKVTLDGNGVSCRGIYASNDARGKGRDSVSVESVATSANTRRAMTFSNIELTDDDAFEDGSAKVQKMGEITITIHPVVMTGRKVSGRYYNCEPQKVHERAKKLGGHCAKLGEAIPCGTRYNTTHKRLDTKPIVKFVFNYKPLDMLRADGLAPPPDRRSQALRNSQHVLVKPDADAIPAGTSISRVPKTETKEKRPLKRVKREPSIDLTFIADEPLSHVAFTPGEVIDLT